MIESHVKVSSDCDSLEDVDVISASWSVVEGVQEIEAVAVIQVLFL